MSKRGPILLAIVICLAMVAQTSPVSAVAPAQAPKVLKIGVEGPHTGPNARVGEEFWDAVTMAFDAINWKIGDYKVEIVKIDDESDPEKATRAYEEAIVREKIDCGLIGWHSSVAVALMEVAAKYKIPHFFGFGATELVNQKYKSDPQKYSYWMGKTWPMPAKLSIAYVETLENVIKKGIWKPEKKVAAIFGEDTDWGRSFGGAIRDQLKAAGWTITGEDYYTMGEVEFTPLITKWKNQGIVLLAGTSTAATSYAALIKQAREQDLKAFVVADGLGWIGEWYSLTGEASDGVLDQIPAWTTPEAKAFRDAFVKKFGITPSASAGGQAYDMANFFIKVAKAALEQYGELNKETLYKTGQEKLWKGELTFSRADGAIIHEMYKYTPESIPDPVVGLGYYIFPVIQYTKGEGKIIWPDAWKEADLKPAPGLEGQFTAAPAAAAAPTKVLKVGVLGPFTGPAARTGAEMKDAATMAFEEINYTVGDYKVELVPIDDQSDPEKANRAYEEAVIRNGIQVGLLGWHSSVAVSTMEVNAKYKVPHFFNMGETQVVNEKFLSDKEKYGYAMAKLWPTPKSLVSRSYALWAKDMLDSGQWKPATMKAAVTCEDTDFGRAVCAPLKEYLVKDGWDVVAEDYWPLEETEFSPLIAKYKSKDVSFTLVSGTAAAGMSGFVKQARESGLKGVLVAHGLGWVGEWYSLTGEASDGVLDQIPKLASEKAKAWAQRFEQKWGMKPSPSAGGLSYDGTNMFIELLKATLKEYGELNKETIYKFGRENLWTTKFVYKDGIVMPQYKWSAESLPDPVIDKDAFMFPVIQYFGGEGKVIWPLDWAEAKLQVK